MTFDEVLSGALDLCGEPNGGTIVVGSGRWNDSEKARAVNASVAYVFDTLGEETEIQTIPTVADSICMTSLCLSGLRQDCIIMGCSYLRWLHPLYQ